MNVKISLYFMKELIPILINRLCQQIKDFHLKEIVISKLLLIFKVLLHVLTLQQIFTIIITNSNHSISQMYMKIWLIFLYKDKIIPNKTILIHLIHLCNKSIMGIISKSSHHLLDNIYNISLISI